MDFSYFSLLTSLDIEGIPKKNTCSFCQSSCEKRSRFYIPRFLDMIQNLSDFQLYLQTIKSQPHHQALDLLRFSSKNENFTEWMVAETMDCIVCKMYLFKLQNVSIQIENVFVQIARHICPNYKCICPSC